MRYFPTKIEGYACRCRRNIILSLLFFPNAMIHFFRFSSILLSLFLCSAVFARDIQASGAWARETLPGQDTGMVSVSVTSKHSASLVAVSSTACKAVEMHQMSHEDNMMKMREVRSIVLPANEKIDFSENGYHLMLVGLKQPLKVGEKIPLVLTIKTNKRITKVKTLAEVKPLATSADDAETMHDAHHSH